MLVWLPWALLAALVALLFFSASRFSSYLRWVRRTLAGFDAGAAPRDYLARLFGLAPLFAAVERRADNEAETQLNHNRQLGELLGLLTQAVVVVDGQDRLQLANPAARRLFRMEQGAEGDSIVPIVRSAELVNFLRLVRNSGSEYQEIRLSRPPAADLWINVYAAPAKGDTYGAGAVIIVAEDSTQLRRLQEVEREFLANLSHDLRTPVTILKGYAETLEQDGPTMSAEDRARFTTKIVTATARLNTMLEGMLALASLEAGAILEPTPGALARAAEETVDALQERAKTQGIALQLKLVNREGRVDALQSRRVVQNLVANALVHGRDARTIHIQVEGARVVVEDDGQGVAEDELTRIFDRLYRTDRSRRQGSTGLGLSIVREIALIHGGWVQAEAVKPRGLRVIVQLDATPKQTAPV